MKVRLLKDVHARRWGPYCTKQRRKLRKGEVLEVYEDYPAAIIVRKDGKVYEIMPKEGVVEFIEFGHDDGH